MIKHVELTISDSSGVYQHYKKEYLPMIKYGKLLNRVIVIWHNLMKLNTFIFKFKFSIKIIKRLNNDYIKTKNYGLQVNYIFNIRKPIDRYDIVC